MKFFNFFSTQYVRQKMISNTLPEWQIFSYFYLIFMYDAIGLTPQCLSIIGKQPSLIDMVNIWGYLILIVMGLLVLFVANGGVRGKNFLTKFFAFSFTVGWKYGLIFIILNSLSTEKFYTGTVYVITNSFSSYDSKHANT